MPGIIKDFHAPYECVTYAMLDFGCDVSHNGPTRALPRATWTSVMERIDHLGWVTDLQWARVAERSQTMVLTIAHILQERTCYLPMSNYGPELHLDGLAELLHPLLPFLQQEPRLISTMREMQAPAPTPTFTADGCTIVDLYLASVRIETQAEAMNHRNPTESMQRIPINPLSYLISLPNYLNVKVRSPTEPRSAKADSEADLRSYSRTSTLTSFYSSPRPGDTCEQVITVGWRNAAARHRFQNPAVVSTAVGQPGYVPYNIWTTGFATPMTAMRRVGKVAALEHWMLEVRPWSRAKSSMGMGVVGSIKMPFTRARRLSAEVAGLVKGIAA